MPPSLKRKIIVIGAGFSGLATAALLAKEGHEVTVLEKNSKAGGRAGVLQSDGFTFDTGPSWYWMPDVFERYFALFGKQPSEYYSLKRLDPSYSFYFGKDEKIEVPASLEELMTIFEAIEEGSAGKLRQFLKEAEYKYITAMSEFVYKPGLSFTEFLHPKLLTSALKLDMLSSFDRHLKTYFKSPRLRQMLEFPVLFLGGTAKNTPALYSLMNYGDIKLGTWYPEGGMYKVVEGMLSLAESQGATFIYNSAVDEIKVERNKVTGVIARGNHYAADLVVASADYHHVEQQLLPEKHRMYSQKYWESRVLSPSSLIFFLGLDTKLKGIDHHTLFFDEDLDKHASHIYENPSWPDKPSLYLSCTSKTDPTVAPEGMENLFVLIPVAPGLKDSVETREKYYRIVLERIQRITGQNISNHVVFKRSYAHIDFEKEFNAFKGNAYGLANTLMQTAFLKPKIRSSKVNNLFFAGQLTVPGPGVPPALISGQIVSSEIQKAILKGTL